MSDSNRTAIRYVEEDSWGVTPTTPTFQELRYTGESLSFNVNNITSTEIRSDRQIDDLVQTGADTSGDLNVELSFKAYDDFISGAMWNSWTSRMIQESVTNLSVDGTSDLFSSTGTPAFNTKLEVGQWIYVSGFTESANNGYHRIFAVTATEVTVETSLTTELAGDSITMKTWVQNTDISADETGGVYTLNSAGEVDWTKQNLNVGQWVKVAGFTEAANNGFAKISAITATDLTLVGLTMVDEVAGDTITVHPCDFIRNGTTEHSYSIERAHQDVTQFFQFTGMVVNQMSISASANSILTGAFSFIGKSGSLAQATASTGGTPTAALSEDVMNAVANVGQIREGGAALASDLFISSIELTLNNNIRGLEAIGNLGYIDIGVGSIDLTGSMSLYFKDNTMYDKYLAGTESSFSFKVEDVDGNAYIFTVPRIKFESDTINAGGINTDIMEEMGFRAIRDSITNCTIQIDKYEA